RRFAIAALHEREHAFPRALVFAVEALGVETERRLAPRGAVQNHLAHLRRQIAPRRVEIEFVLFGEGGEHRLAQMARRLAPRKNDALEDRDARIAEDELFGHLAARA